GVPDVTFTGHAALWANSTRDVYTSIGGLTPGQTYTFSVAAVSPAGTGQPLAGNPVTPGPAAAPTLMLDGTRLALNRYQLAHDTASARLRSQLATLRKFADDALTAGPWAVTDKTQVPPSGDKHDYLSQAPYWWPNPNTPDGCPYIRKDGQRNPDVDKIPDHATREQARWAIHDLTL